MGIVGKRLPLDARLALEAARSGGRLGEKPQPEGERLRPVVWALLSLAATALACTAALLPGARSQWGHPSVAGGDWAVTETGVAVRVPVRTNDSASAGVLSVTSVGQPHFGSAGPDHGDVNYVPRPGFEGFDEFSYTVADRQGRTAVGRVTVLVARPFGFRSSRWGSL